MKLKTLVYALDCAITCTNEPEHLNTLLQARDECIALRNVCDDGLDTHVSVVSWCAFSCIMSSLTYDEFGRIRKANLHNERRQTKLYREACRDYCEELTDGQIDSVADFLRDLWDDNEQNECHRPDGAMRSSAPQLLERVDLLGTIINKLYHHRGLSEDDLSAIQLFIH